MSFTQSSDSLEGLARLVNVMMGIAFSTRLQIVNLDAGGSEWRTPPALRPVDLDILKRQKDLGYETKSSCHMYLYNQSISWEEIIWHDVN